MLPAMATLAVIALALALLAGAPRPPRDDDDAPLVERVNALLPQTQCGQCLYDGCRPYAEAIIAGEANINRCPPGGQVTIDTLARLLGRPRIALDPRHGSEAPPRVAFIREDLCIGCKLCIKACPVDAILGSAKLMHTVIAAECTGCELCVAPCPVDCIDLLDVDHPGHGWLRPLPVPSPAGGA